ncbi:putative membrane protein YesL [Metabacillus crassostreae]|uniref:YesL family protein n=1 Tax=Metabacillus crassostreae TaxID=929098 RepID=UPI00195AEE80|nr:YesL family protein [Metabacillus crassostreae]MBM7603828.1 putative membrane protein YesL [Metabacillus crassostreae]
MGTMDKLYNVAEWIMRLCIVNLLWFLFTLCGLVVFGLFPATAAMFTITRKWTLGDYDVPLFKTFWSTFKKEFLQANVLGIIFYLIAGLLYINYLYTKSLTDGASILMIGGFFSLCLFFVILMIHIFPLFVHYRLTTFQYIKRAFLIGMIKPLNTLLMIVGSYAIFYMLSSIPGLNFFFLFSSISFYLSWMSLRTYKKFEQQEAESTL